jgi:hypothetical protein
MVRWVVGGRAEWGGEEEDVWVDRWMDVRTHTPCPHKRFTHTVPSKKWLNFQIL